MTDDLSITIKGTPHGESAVLSAEGAVPAAGLSVSVRNLGKSAYRFIASRAMRLRHWITVAVSSLLTRLSNGIRVLQRRARKGQGFMILRQSSILRV